MKKILIVDDSPVARRMLKKCIPELESFEIVEAVDGKDGVDKFKDFSPDITFMDLTMPVLDGYDALKQIISLNSKAVVIVLTADIQPKSLSNVMESGAFTVLKKPAKTESIKDVLEKVQYKLNEM